MHYAYPEPVAALLSYGDPEELKENSDDPYGWPDYIKEFSLSLNDLPQLTRMLNDPTTKHTESGNPQIWADIHAWRAIGQLGAVEAIPDLIRYLDDESKNDIISYWITEEIPRVFAKIGTSCIQPLSEYINNAPKGTWWGVAIAGEGLSYIVQEYPESRDLCVAAITCRLERYMENDEQLNGSLIYALMNLKAVESLEVIRDVFRANAVDTFMDDLEDVEIELGVRQTRSTPAPHDHEAGWV